MTRITVGITGASGALVAVDVLSLLKEVGVETHLVVTHWGGITLEHETGMRPRDLQPLVHTVHSQKNLAAPIASGSFRMDGMIVVPCSARTLAAIAHGTDPTLLGRAADVCLKERWPLVCALRESPLSAIHLGNAVAVERAGGIVAPLVPAFYANPRSVEELVHDMACRLIGHLGIEMSDAPRWSENIGLELRKNAGAHEENAGAHEEEVWE